ncbi:hypothetical protein C173_10041 [Paenibacillus sp. FSL R7-277]|uniref:Wadjet anti-phage system protein JetD domain-containing protein n=1 Tax=Paenibacillus sp. FSL R7-277 TaxID=1227352 RepID=UPI0003E2789F|nr:Wadjet anti-phage system protein JetD domain-containing protein [Paenibacillus sp. FSL R7-277]ETT74132.1 hypothetical protein C173_10041 [Paenibacillus sp. FSL R7-277]
MNEQEFKGEFKNKLLNHLLNKYERSKAFIIGEETKQRPQLLLIEEPFKADFEDEMNFRKREWMHQVIEVCLAEGIVDVRRERSSHVIQKVYLKWEKIEFVYKQVGRQPKRDKLAELRSILGELNDHPWDWLAKWAQGTVMVLGGQRSGGMDLNDLKSYVDAVRVLKELPSISGDIPKRMLSMRVFGNSKYFERYVERRLLSIIKQGMGEASELGEGELDLIGIVPHPKPVLLGGCGQFTLNGKPLSLELFPDGMALYPETLKVFQWVELNAERIVMIENLSTYHQWFRVRQPVSELVIYTGGFPHRILQSFLRRLWDELQITNASFSVFHWGDIDLGGLQIYRFLQRDCPFDIRPLFMDEGTLTQFGEAGGEHLERYCQKANDLLQNDSYANWHILLETMAKTGLRLEQEAVPDELVQKVFNSSK